MRSILASLSLVILCTALRLDALGSCASRIETISMDPITGGGVTITLPASWKTTQEHYFEAFAYFFTDKEKRMFSAGFLNNPDIGSLEGNPAMTSVTSVLLNSLKATEFRKKSGLSDIIVENRCGGYKYVWLHVVSTDPERLAEISAAMKSVACIPVKTR
jgi:hypothetical protein